MNLNIIESQGAAVGFFLQICDVAEMADLARSGYRLDINSRKNQNPSIFLATYWNFIIKI